MGCPPVDSTKRFEGIGRFPDDFMFRITTAELNTLLSQIAIANRPGRGGSRDLPRAFAEQGVAMLSSVLRNDRAVAVNVLIMRTFVQIRRAAGEASRLGHPIDKVERRLHAH